MFFDEALKKELKAAHSSPRNFALVISAKPGLILSRSPIGGAALKNKQLECGGGTVLRGRCFGADGVLVFETATRPAGGVAEKLKVLVKKHTGLTLELELRQKDQIEEVRGAPEVQDRSKKTVEETEEPVPDPKVAALTAALKERFKNLMPRVLQAKRYAPDREEDLDQLVEQATAAALNGNDGAMTQALTELHQLANIIWTPGPQDHVTTVLKQRLRKLMPGFQRALELQPERKRELDQLLAEANRAAQGGRLEETMNLLDNLEADIHAAGGDEPGGEPPTGVDPIEPSVPQPIQRRPRVRRESTLQGSDEHPPSWDQLLPTPALTVKSWVRTYALAKRNLDFVTANPRGVISLLRQCERDAAAGEGPKTVGVFTAREQRLTRLIDAFADFKPQTETGVIVREMSDIVDRFTDLAKAALAKATEERSRLVESQE